MNQPNQNKLYQPITDSDINRYFPNGVSIIQYKDLKNYRNINELLNNPYEACFILFVNNSNMNSGGVLTISGHWNLIYKNNNDLYLFDSYGTDYIDKNLLYINQNKRKKYDENEPLLSNLILNDPSIKRIYTNSKKYQLLNNVSQTCGRHCIYRLLNKNLSNEAYHKQMLKLKKKNKKNNYDNLIIEMIN